MAKRQQACRVCNNNAREDGLVAVEIVEGTGSRGADAAGLYFRRDDQTVRIEEPFTPFLFVEKKALSASALDRAGARELRGDGRLNMFVRFKSWAEWKRARARLADGTGFTAGAPDAPFLAINDPVQQHLLLTRRTHFGGMQFEQLRRMQVDIETHTAPGFDFCNPERESDRIIVIAMGDNSGWEEALWDTSGDEKRLLQQFVERVRERDPDVLEGHNIFKFDLAYMAERAARHGVELSLGRDGSRIRSTPGRYTAGERVLAYPKFEIAGRHVVDTYFLLQTYDVSHRSMDGFGLKQAAAHFNISAPRRTRIEGSEISSVFERDPKKVLRYALDDIRETRALASLLSRSAFVQAQMLPFSYQSACLRGSAAKIDALMIREYVDAGCALPSPATPREFRGGYTDIFMRGVIRNVHHCDARSLYPSIMLSRRIGPESDYLGAFLKLLARLKEMRDAARRKMREARDPGEQTHFESMQAALKILVNSFYGYLGFAQGRFNDFSAAERVAAEGRSILKQIVEWLRAHGAKPIEIDTDGVYFVPPTFRRASERESFREEVRRSLPEGIELEFDGEYRSMFSYKMKNYALLDRSGNLTIRGAALKSRGLEPYMRSFLRDLVRMKLESRDNELPALKERYEQAVAGRTMGIRQLAKTETLKDSPQVYAEKVSRGGRGRNAAYELALRSARPYRAGDQVSYYITGSAKNVSAHQSAKLVSEWDPAAPDENTAYYSAKLEALYKRFR